MVMNDQSIDDPDWPRWGETATRGDLIQIAIRQRAISTRLATALLMFLNGHEEEARLAWNDYFAENAKLEKLIDKLGGGRDG